MNIGSWIAVAAMWLAVGAAGFSQPQSVMVTMIPACFVTVIVVLKGV